MRKIKAVKVDNKDYIFINRGRNNFLFTSEQLNEAKKRYDNLTEKQKKECTESTYKKVNKENE